MKISFDPDADAVYVHLTDAATTFGETLVEEDGTVIDTDASGKARGFEWLMVSSRGIRYQSLPDDVPARVRKVMDAGLIGSKNYIEVALDE